MLLILHGFPKKLFWAVDELCEQRKANWQLQQTTQLRLKKKCLVLKSPKSIYRRYWSQRSRKWINREVLHLCYDLKPSLCGYVQKKNSEVFKQMVIWKTVSWVSLFHISLPTQPRSDLIGRTKFPLFLINAMFCQ
jgi:hypothetical protein